MILTNISGMIFKKRANKIWNVLFKSYPEADHKLKINDITLRYIDGIDFNYEENNIFNFLKDKLKVGIFLEGNLFKNTGVSEYPLSYDLRLSFRSDKPKGSIRLRFVKGKRKGKDALIWETICNSKKEEAPKKKKEIVRWLKNAHQLTRDWFFKLIEGELYERFK